MSFGMVAASYLAVAADHSYAGLVMSHSPLLYWRLNDTIGTTATDSSGNSRDGAYVNSPFLGDQPLLAGDSVTSVGFNKTSDQRAELAYSTWMDANAVTIACLYQCQHNSFAIEALAARYRDGTNDISWLLYCEDKEFKFLYRTVGGQTITIASGIFREIGATYYVAAYAGAGGAGIRIYSGGVLLGSVTSTAQAVASSTRLFTVADTDANEYPISGLLQEVVYFGAVLPSSNIDTLASKATAPQPKWLNRKAGTAPRNGTSAHTLTFPAASPGSLLVAVVAGGVISTATTPGWTKRVSPVQACELAVFTRAAAGGETSLALACSGSNYPLDYVVYELPTGTSWLTSAGTNNGHAPDLTGLPGTPVLAFSALVMASTSPSDPTPDTVWGFGWTDDVDSIVLDDGVTDGVYLTVGWRVLYTETTISPSTEGYFAGPVYAVNPQIAAFTTANFVLNLP